MDINQGSVTALAEYLLQTLSPDPANRKQAERCIASIEKGKNYSLILLTLVSSSNLDITIRTTGAITFKNFIKRNWATEEGRGNNIHEEMRGKIKELIVDLMLKSPKKIQRQLSDAIAEIGKSDFPEKWPTLIKDMTDKFATGDFNIINGVLQTANTLFARYRFENRSHKLWMEIRYVMANFAHPFTELFFATKDLTVVHRDNKEALKVIFGSLKLFCEIFEALTFQDVPEYFEDNMERWMAALLQLLAEDVPLLNTDNEEEPGILEEMKTVICSIAQMFASKYNDDLQPYLDEFVTSVWNLLTTTGKALKFDLLISNAINFLSCVASKDSNRSLFEAPDVLDGICKCAILPNMEFRLTDEELFEDNPEEYIRRDVEGSDVDTRRRAACDLVRALSKFFETKMTQVFGTYIQTMLASYAADPAKNWRNKDAAIYLVIALASKRATQKYGTTQTNPLVNLSDFFHQNIVPDLISTNVNELPVLKADAIKYVMTFRSQLGHGELLASIPCLINLLTASSQVIHSYAAIALDKILSMETADAKKPVIQKEELSPFAESLLSNLLLAFSLHGSGENDHLVRTLSKSLLALREQAVPYLTPVVTQLIERLKLAVKSPSKPVYNHYIFESLSVAISIVCKVTPAAVDAFEDLLFPVFQEVLTQDVQDFVPYVFQVSALLRELHSAM
ncbi:exportin-2-like [Artemia franciscana]|uniref:Exportin-2 n=1 Tax=Artemia franciscana TaxID=6661 RepID=A0AA88IGU8_ARTSF|nr:hypothetical protein QYM36_008420 [Artemia franciscana]